MGQRVSCVVWALLLAADPRARAGDDDAAARAKRELLPRSVTLQGEISVSGALAQLHKQTANRVVDRRQIKTDLRLRLDLANTTFWPAAEAIARAAGGGISTYQPDGQVALVDAPQRPMATAYQGIFRITAKRLNVARDDDAGTHTCTVTLDVAWEPRFEPLYLEADTVDVIFAADKTGVQRQVKVAGQGKFGVAGRNALEVDLRMPAPDRTSGKIKSLAGRFHLIGPGKMLTFAFPSLTPIKKKDRPLRQTQDGVQVSVVEVKPSSGRWSVEVHVDNPPGNPDLESFQKGYWLGNNRISLEKGEGAARTAWTPRSGDEEWTDPTSTHAEIRYHFLFPAKDNKGPLSDWTLIYRTPGRIVEIAVPFAFKDLRLP
jgi:hypothetical protein